MCVLSLCIVCLCVYVADHSIKDTKLPKNAKFDRSINVANDKVAFYYSHSYCFVCKVCPY